MRLSQCALVILAISAFAYPTPASELYSLDSSAPASIYRLNQTTGAEALIGPVGAFAFPGDLTSDTSPANFRIWSPDITSNTLLKIDPLTGAATPIGTFLTPAGGPVKIVSIAFDPTTSTMWGNTSQGFDGNPDRLFRIDPNTAQSIPVGNAIGHNNVFALGFTQTGKLYGVSDVTDQLIGIDTTLGTGTAIGPTGLNAIFDIASRPEDDAMFAVDALTNSLYRMDVNTGGTGLIGAHTSAHNMVGLAFGPVPEPGTFALLAIGAGLATLRRRR
jgi:hypothetical protein